MSYSAKTLTAMLNTLPSDQPVKNLLHLKTTCEEMKYIRRFGFRILKEYTFFFVQEKHFSLGSIFLTFLEFEAEIFLRFS